MLMRALNRRPGEPRPGELGIAEDTMDIAEVSRLQRTAGRNAHRRAQVLDKLRASPAAANSRAASGSYTPPLSPSPRGLNSPVSSPRGETEEQRDVRRWYTAVARAQAASESPASSPTPPRIVTRQALLQEHLENALDSEEHRSVDEYGITLESSPTVEVHDEHSYNSGNTGSQSTEDLDFMHQHEAGGEMPLHECTRQLMQLQQEVSAANATWREFYRSAEAGVTDTPDLAADELVALAVAQLRKQREVSHRQQLVQALWTWWRVVADRALVQNKLMQMEREVMGNMGNIGRPNE